MSIPVDRPVLNHIQGLRHAFPGDPSGWQIADPLLGAAIRRLWQGEGPVEPDLDIDAEL